MRGRTVQEQKDAGSIAARVSNATLRRISETARAGAAFSETEQSVRLPRFRAGGGRYSRFLESGRRGANSRLYGRTAGAARGVSAV